jgi:uncharacterized protein (TIGR00369 family)
MMEETLERLPGSPGCFICDSDESNPRALRLKIMWDDKAQVVKIPFCPDRGWCGYSDIVHGGLVAAVLDEAMAWAVKRQSGQWAFTADFHLRYKKPVEPGRHYTVVAGVGELGGRKITAQARMLDQNERPVALAEAIFMPKG